MPDIIGYIKEKFTDLSPTKFNNINQYQKDIEQVNKIYDMIYEKISKGYQIFNLHLYCVDSRILNSIITEMNKNGWDIVVSGEYGYGEISVDFKFNRKYNY